MDQQANIDRTKIIEQINEFPSEEEERLRLEHEKVIEENFIRLNKQHEKRKLRRKFLKRMVLTFVITVTIIIGSYTVFKENSSNKKLEKISIPIDKDADHVFVNDTQGVIDEKRKEDDWSNGSEGSMGKSENYQIKDIVLGGGAMLLSGETENLPIEVTDIRSESITSKDGKEAKLLISWKTNKLAQTAVEYKKDGMSTYKVLKENGYGFSHALILTKLEPSTRYVFVIAANDRNGKEIKSGSFAVFTGTKPVSVFDLISGEMDKLFGWAIR